MRIITTAIISAFLLSCQSPQGDDSDKAQTDINQLAESFQHPPMSSRPRTWWHWINGNISKDGVEKDLAWMKDIGLGGVHMFDGALGRAVIVDNPPSYMSEQWQDTLSHAVGIANDYGFEFTIAASPGWSQTGGPWVKPEDGMKKLVWNEVTLANGQAHNGPLPSFPTQVGVYQNLALNDAHKSHDDDKKAGEYSNSVAVMAFPITGKTLTPDSIFPTQGLSAPSALIDGRMDMSAKLKKSNGDGLTTLIYEYNEAVEVRSATMFLSDGRPPFRNAKYAPILEYEKEGTWHEIATLRMENVPDTQSFPTVTAQKFRLSFTPNPAPYTPISTPAPGAQKIDFFAQKPKDHIEIGEFSLSSQAKVNHSEMRAGFGVPLSFATLGPAAPNDETAIARGDVLDLTTKLQSDGTLNWTPPDNRDWKIMHYGYSLTGKTNHPARPEATGLEVDKYDGDAVKRYLDTYYGNYQSALKAGQNISGFLTDSIEVGPSNWTHDMAAKFETLRGYDPTPFLPVLSGTVIGSTRETESFLNDWRQTLEDLLATEHYATIAEFANEHDLTLYGEAQETGRHVFGDDLQMRAYTDVPMGALWSFNKGGKPRPVLIGDIKGAASVANVYGKKYVAAESMTSMNSPWAFAPKDLKRVIDQEFLNGVNRPVIHTSVHQPSDDLKPGLSLAIFGQYFNRHETWADMAGPWIEYISRCSFMLQQGNRVAEVAVFAGDSVPVTVLYEKGIPEHLPQKYDFDFVNSEIIRDELSFENDLISSKAGAKYKAIYVLPGADMGLDTLQKLAELKDSGAVIIGPTPKYAPSLNTSAADFNSILNRIWQGENRSIDTVLAEFFPPEISNLPKGVTSLRRETKSADITFLVNTNLEPVSFAPKFENNFINTEIWNPIEGTATALDSDGALELGPEESVFLVASQVNSPSLEATSPKTNKTVLDLENPWFVSFEAGKGAPEEIEMESLIALNDHDSPPIRYYSGQTKYTTSFDLSPSEIGKEIWLDLGEVGDVARITLNDVPLGVEWIAPYRVETSAALKTGENVLQVEVANVWVNRLIGDKQPNASPFAKVFAPTYTASAPLRPAGLIGPVRLIKTTQ